MLSAFLSLVGAALIVELDQLIKKWATASLAAVGAMPLIPGLIELRYVLNDGMAFSMLSGKQKLLIGMTTIMLIGIAAWLLIHKMTAVERIAWTMVLGGGVGNLIDRVTNGQVVDYINLLFVHFAVFNFADICVCCGVGLLMFYIVLGTMKAEKSK